MRFDVKCVLDHLLREGKVYTLRTYKARRDIAFRLGVDGEFYTRRYVQGPVQMAQIAPYAPLSGFASVGAWWQAAQGFARSCSLYLYLVERK